MNSSKEEITIQYDDLSRVMQVYQKSYMSQLGTHLFTNVKKIVEVRLV